MISKPLGGKEPLCVRLFIQKVLTALAKVGQAVIERLEPPKFVDAATESIFIADFRSAGLRLTFSACCIAIAGYLLIGTADIAFSGWSTVAATRRLLPIMLLGLIVYLVVVRPTGFLRHYNAALGALSLIAYGLSVSMTHYYREDDPTMVVNPTALIGLWIIYGFVRLPLRLTVCLCALGGALALFGSRVTNMPDPMTRTLIYLLVGNALGIILARSIEVRERQLFSQRRTLEDAQIELQRRSSTAEEASAEKSRLVAAIGHDLRQPMMAAVLHLSVLMRRARAKDTAGVELQADRVQDSVLLLKESLEHLLLSARYDAGVEQVRIASVAVKEVLHRLSDLCDSRDGVKLTIRVPQRAIIVRTDPQILLRALVNLVDNALKFARVNAAVRSRVVVRAVVRDGECRIAVIDNGIGIAGSDVESIWRPFSQVGTLAPQGVGGLGLGLYLVRQLLLKVEGHRIRVRSVLGRGACFIVTVPAVAEVANAIQPFERSDSFNEGHEFGRVKGAYILLVEDDQNARFALHALFAEWGVLWSSGATLAEALEGHGQSERRVDMIIADFRLSGGLSGIECVRSARTILGYCPCAVLVTAEVDVESLTDQLPEKCALLKKPFNPSVLCDLLYAALTAALEEERKIFTDPEDYLPVIRKG